MINEAMKMALEWFQWFHQSNAIESAKSSTQVKKALEEALAQPAQKPLSEEQIFAIGKQLGLKCRLGGNASIDVDYARAIERAHGIGGAK